MLVGEIMHEPEWYVERLEDLLALPADNSKDHSGELESKFQRNWFGAAHRGCKAAEMEGYLSELSERLIENFYTYSVREGITTTKPKTYKNIRTCEEMIYSVLADLKSAVSSDSQQK